MVIELRRLLPSSRERGESDGRGACRVQGPWRSPLEKMSFIGLLKLLQFLIGRAIKAVPDEAEERAERGVILPHFL